MDRWAAGVLGAWMMTSVGYGVAV